MVHILLADDGCSVRRSFTVLPLDPLEAFVLRNGGRLNRSADGGRPRTESGVHDGQLHQKLGQVNRILDGHRGNHQGNGKGGSDLLHRRPQLVGWNAHLLQHFIARLMAKALVILMKAIHVQQRQCQRRES